MQDKFFSLVLILLPLSFISERIANIIKLYLPSKGFFSLGNLKMKEKDPIKEKVRERKMLFVSIVAGSMVALVSKADLFTLLKDSDRLGWDTLRADESIFWVILGCVLTATFLSWGSKFWHDLLDILLYTKNVKRFYGGVREGSEYQSETTSTTKEVLSSYKTNILAASMTTLSDSHCEPQDDLEDEEKLPKIDSDPISLKRIQLLHPKLREEALTIYKEVLERRVNIRITHTLRTIDEQNELYAQGRTKPGNKVTNAKGGQSYHNFGLAIDFVLLFEGGKRVSWDREIDMDEDKIKDWEEVVHVFKSFGWSWGGDWRSFKDYPHFEKTFGYKTSELFTKFNDKKVDSEGYVIIDESPIV